MPALPLLRHHAPPLQRLQDVPGVPGLGAALVGGLRPGLGAPPPPPRHPGGRPEEAGVMMDLSISSSLGASATASRD